MINSNIRKLTLSGWLKKHYRCSFDSSLKLQKFLLLYESFCKVFNEKYDFNNLRGWERGPVFSNVWGDYTKEKIEFLMMSKACYENNFQHIKEDIAQKCGFIVSSLTEQELSNITHEMNIWKAQYYRIHNGERNVTLCELDFNQNDEQIIRSLDEMYPIEMINNSEIINLKEKYFIISKSNITKLKSKHFNVLTRLSECEELNNPVFVDIDEEGRLLID
ncbi:hypothetical protein [Ureaplasma ceti]|uniref:Antitoxin SocA-like Panacea domain-containing protein n=1 Tax=Ureaplasma ceti TaxID=3119530 RepID=A0ABP9U6B9_9BACT